jgi:hypothetical protein
MLLLEKKLPSGSTVSLSMQDDGQQLLKIHSPRPSPAWLRESVGYDPKMDDEKVLVYIYDRCLDGNPTTVREMRDRLSSLPALSGVTRDRFESALTRLKESGAVLIDESTGGRGLKRQVVPNIVLEKV